MFSGKKSELECRKLSVNDMLHPKALYVELAPAQFHCNLPLFYYKHQLKDYSIQSEHNK